MNREEIEELKDFTIDLTDIDELALGLEICSKKSNMVIQEFIDTIFQLQQENKKLKEVIDKAIKYIEYNNETLYTYEPDYDYEENIVSNYDISNYREDLLKILKGEE